MTGRSWYLVFTGALMVLVGFLLTMHGLDTEATAWAILGPLLAGFGVALVMVTFSRRT